MYMIVGIGLQVLRLKDGIPRALKRRDRGTQSTQGAFIERLCGLRVHSSAPAEGRSAVNSFRGTSHPKFTPRCKPCMFLHCRKIQVTAEIAEECTQRNRRDFPE